MIFQKAKQNKLCLDCPELPLMYVCLHVHTIWVGESKKKKSVTMVKRKARGEDNCNFNKL